MKKIRENNNTNNNVKILSATAGEGPWLTSRLLASPPRMSLDTEVDDHAASIKLTCGPHVVSSSRYSWYSQSLILKCIEFNSLL